MSREWENARPGELWQITLNDGIVLGVAASQGLGTRPVGQMIFEGEGFHDLVTNHDIVAGKRVWPSETPELPLDNAPYVVYERDEDWNFPEVARGATREALKADGFEGQSYFKPRRGFSTIEAYYRAGIPSSRRDPKPFLHYCDDFGCSGHREAFLRDGGKFDPRGHLRYSVNREDYRLDPQPFVNYYDARDRSDNEFDLPGNLRDFRPRPGYSLDREDYA